MLVTDSIEENTFDDLFVNRKTNAMEFDDELDMSQEIVEDVLLSLDNKMDYTSSVEFGIKNEQPLSPYSSSSSSAFRTDYSIKSSPPSSYTTESLSDYNELNDFNYVNPDDFLYDVDKYEVKSEEDSPNRNTPSPLSTGSSECNGQYPNNSNQILQKNDINSTNLRSYFENVDTPPISPPSFSISQPPPLSPQQQPIIINSNQPNGIQIVQGTLIPITAVPISTDSRLKLTKSIKIQPKPIAISNTANGGINKGNNLNKKTIILSAQDFSALVKNVKSSRGSSVNPETSIILKPNSQIKREPPVVLPKLYMPSAKVVSATDIIAPMPALVATSGMTTAPMTERVDVKNIKKQQRMIKNRESACLSRKKKKEYVTSLEQAMAELKSENITLKTKNAELQDRLQQLTISAVCNCKKLATFTPSTLISSANMKKSTAFVFAVLFMVSVNVGNFGLLGSLNTDTAAATAGKTFAAAPVHHSRGLLWVDDNKFNDSIAYDDDMSVTSDANNRYPICPMYINQTENIRIAKELRQWIGQPEYFNLTNKNTAANLNSFDMYSISDLLAVVDGGQQHKVKVDKVKPSTNKRKFRNPKRRLVTQTVPVSSDDSNIQPYRVDNQIEVFDGSFDASKYAKFFEEIRRRDDTFYVVSFSGDHLLLPALAHNKTLRPRMSLMLPALGKNDTNDFVTLMQIDCEVINTSMLHVREESIPAHLKNTNRSSTDKSPKDNAPKTDVPKFSVDTNITSESKKPTRPHKPYFVEKTLHTIRNSNYHSTNLKP